MSGTCDPNSQAIIMEGHMDDPVMGKKDVWYKSIITPHHRDKWSMAMYHKGEDGKEFKAMEITYTRIK